MSNVMIRGLMKVHKANRRAANEQARELAHLRHRAYRGVETVASQGGEAVHGNFVYRGIAYTKWQQLNNTEGLRLQALFLCFYNICIQY